MNSISWRVVALGVLILSAGCGGAPEGEPGSEAEPGPVAEQEPSAPQLEGSYRFAQLNELRPPLEWPAGSGSTLESGTLNLDPAGSYSMQFIVGRGELGSEPSGNRGTYRTSADTLVFTPEGNAAALVVFQYELAANGELRLRDGDQNLWIYTPRSAPR